MKRENLLFSLVMLVIVAGVTFAQISPGNLSEKGNDGAKDARAYIQKLRQNQVTGIIDPVDVRNARAAVKEQSSLKQGMALDLNWTSVGPDNIGGRTRSVVIDRNNPNTVYAGSVGGGVWKSTTGASSWVPMTVNGSDNSAISVSCMDQAANGTLYVGTGEGWYEPDGGFGPGGFFGTGLYKSTDGNDLSVVSGTDGWDFINEICVDQTSGRIYVATEQGLFYSDNESTWTLASAGTDDLDGVAYDVCIGSNSIVVASVDNMCYISETGSPDGFVNHSTGASGKLPNTNVGRIEFDVAPSNPDYIYAMAASEIGTMVGVYRSTDKGNTWTIIGPSQSSEFPVFDYISSSGISYLGLYNNVIKVYPSNPDIVLVGGADLYQGFKVVEGGFFGWTQTSSYALNPLTPLGVLYAHQGHNDYAFHPTQPGTAYMATDGGIFKAVQNVGFQAKNKNYNTSQFFSVGFSYNGDVIGGAKDNGTLLIDGEGNTPEEAEQVYGGDGAQCAMSLINPLAYIVSQPEGFVRRSVDFGENWRPVLEAAVTGPGAAYIAPFVLWESFSDEYSLDSVTFVADTNYNAGETVIVRSHNHQYPFPYELPMALGTGDQIRVQDPIAARMFFGATNGVWMTDEILNFNIDPRWAKIGEFTGTAQALAVSPDGDVLYAGTQEGMLYRMSNIKSYRNDSTAHDIVFDTIFEWPGRVITSISFSPSDPNFLVVTLGNYGNTDYIFGTDEALSADPSFDSFQNNLPPMPVYTSMIELSSSDRAIIGTEMGVWSTHDMGPGAVWEHEDNGIPDVPVFDIKQQTSPQLGWYIPIISGIDTTWEVFPGMMNYGVIYVATHGRGLFKSEDFVGTQDHVDAPSHHKSNINVFPNPATDMANVEFTLYRNSDVHLQVYDMSGRILLTEQYSGLAKGKNKVEVDLHDLTQGTYIIRLIDQDQPIGVNKLMVR